MKQLLSNQKNILGCLLAVTYYLLLALIAKQVDCNQPKIDCHPIDGASKEKCENLGCTWSPVEHKTENEQFQGQILPFGDHSRSIIEWMNMMTSSSNVNEPWCYFPSDYSGYQIVDRQENRIYLNRVRKSALSDDIERVLVELEDIGSLFRIRISDAKNQRYEPEIPRLNLDHFKGDSRFNIEVSATNHLIVRRKSTGATLFETDLTKLIFSDKFIQLNSKLDSKFVYGLGEHFDTFLKSADRYKAYSFYHTDRVPQTDGRRSYSSFPFYVNFDSEDQIHAHGIYLRNSDPMDIVLQSDQSVTFRPIGGILDFFIFSGPTPIDVITQYQHLVGLPDLPPRWSLGFHLCRYNYGTLEKTIKVYNRTRESGIPFDIQWNDIDNMERHNDFTYDMQRFKGLPDFIDELHRTGMHYMLLIDPGLSQEDNYRPYSLGVEMDIFVKNATNQTLVGKVWNDSGRTVFPDFSNNKSIEYWSKLFVEFQSIIKFDGAWIDMNDISNFVDGSLDGCPYDNGLERPPYKPSGYNLQTKSLCLSAKHRAGNEYDLHNLYSFYEAISTFHALNAARPGKRPFVISRSTSPGQGHYGGHWSGDVLSTWDYLKWSIPSLIEHSMYGFSMMGTDICGFTGNTTPELCARWSTLGAFYTFSRNHNDDVSIDQDPVALGQDVVEANKNALSKKYRLLPYLYTLIHRAHRYGEPVIRSVPFEFFDDKEARKVEYQFMWGKGLMISPIVDQNTYQKTTYLPKGRWYETNIIPSPKGTFHVPKWIDSVGEWYTSYDVKLSDIPLFYRGGHILPVYPIEKQTTTEIAQQPIGLLIPLCHKSKALGELIIDDGDNVDGKHNHLVIAFEDKKLIIKQDHDGYKSSIGFGMTKVIGVSFDVNAVKANGRNLTFRRQEHVLFFNLEDIQVSNSQDLVVELL